MNMDSQSSVLPVAFISPMPPWSSSSHIAKHLRASSPRRIAQPSLRTRIVAATDQRKSHSPTPSESEAAEAATVASALHTIPRNAVPYFAYFANMNPNKIGPMSNILSRRCHVYASQKAVLPSHSLVFDVPGFPPEPAFANLKEDASSTVEGVIHWLTPNGFERIARSEGVLPDGPFTAFAPFPSPANIAELKVVIENDNAQKSTIRAKAVVFSFSVPRPVRTRMRPSRRYVQVAIDGAEFWGLSVEYVQKLRAIPIERGLLGGFGIYKEPRPHVLDRPNTYEQFGNPSSEIYSPWGPIRTTSAVEVIERDDRETKGSDLRLLRIIEWPDEGAQRKRRLYYIPGIDGTGKGILSQIDDLQDDGVYNVSSIVYPFSNRQSLEELAQEIIRMIHTDSNGSPVSIVAESMGGVIALLLATENIQRQRIDSPLPHLKIDLLLLLNPATCFRRSNPRTLWNFLLGLGLSEEAYAQLLPPILLPFIMDLDSVREKFGPELIPRLQRMLFSLSEISQVLPQDALSWRIQLLSEFSVTRDQLEPVGGELGPSKVALISTINDNLIPSHSESYRMRRYIPNLYTIVLPYGGHVPTFDSRFSLPDFLKPLRSKKDSHFSKREGKASSTSILRRREAFKKRFATAKEHNAPDLSRRQLGKLRNYLEKITENTSPVFVGEENIPLRESGRPVLFVGNHTLLGWIDALYPVQRILETRDVLLRSLAHPLLFAQGQTRFPDTPRATLEDIEEFGILQVSPRQLLQQLARGSWILLFPGGAKEALKRPEDDKYCLKWPESPEFIRSCALFGATIVPVSTVGTEDMVRVLASSERVFDAIAAGSRLLGRPVDESMLGGGAKRWRGNADSGDPPLVPPLLFPTGADRVYFRFGKPIEVAEACFEDKNLEKEIYGQVRDRVAEGVKVLLQRRELDDYRSLESRQKFKESFGEKAVPPCGSGWLWTKEGAFLDEDGQPPLRS